MLRKSFFHLAFFICFLIPITVFSQIECGSISGLVTRADGVEMANVWVGVYDSNQQNIAGNFTGADGKYTIGDILPGCYKVVFKPNFWGPCSSEYLSEWYNDKSGFEFGDMVCVTALQTTQNINAVLEVGGRISGTVTDSISGAGVGSVRVTVYDTSYNQICGTYTDGNGDYTIQGLVTGSYKVLFSAPGQCYASQWYNNKAGFNLADEVVVTAPDTTANINAVLNNTCSTTTSIVNTTTTYLSSTTTIVTTTSTTTTSIIDSDNDGIPDNEDNCPNKPNGPALGICSATSDNPGINCTSDADCANGCSSNGECFMTQDDADSDGVGDVCDNCAAVCNPQQLDADTDRLGDLCDNDPGCGGCGAPACEQPCS